jgi:hypothetical protein
MFAYTASSSPMPPLSVPTPPYELPEAIVIASLVAVPLEVDEEPMVARIQKLVMVPLLPHRKEESGLPRPLDSEESTQPASERYIPYEV